MTTRKLALGLAAVLVVAALAAWLFWPRAPIVQTIETKRAPAVRMLAVNGNVRPRLSVDVRSPVPGTLVNLGFDVGDRVAAGTLLARVDDAPQRAAIAEAQAAVAAQEPVLAQARRDLARFVELGQFATRLQREQARVAVDQAEQELRRLRASVVQARDVRDRYDIRASFAGIILERPVDPGQTISGETIIYRLADLRAAEITAEVDEIYAVQLKPGSPALVSLPDNATPLRATVAHIEPRVDPSTGAREVRLRVAEPLNNAPAGLTVTVNLLVDRIPSAISIPRSAILQPESDPRVRLVGEDGLVAERRIRFSDWPAATVVVTKGLEPGMRILANPKAAAPGSRVRLRD